MEEPSNPELIRASNWKRIVLITAFVGLLAGFLVSYSFTPRYVAQSIVLVEGQKIPDTYVPPLITTDFAERVQSLSEQIKSPILLRRMLENLHVKPEDENKLINQIQNGIDIQPLLTAMSAAAVTAPAANNKPSASNASVAGFQLSYTDSDPARAQAICNALTNLMLDQNIRSRSEVANTTVRFLSDQLGVAKRTVDEQDTKLAAFQKQYMGQLPTDVDNNMRMLISLNSQLDATTQTLNRANRDQAYAEQMLAQRTAAWKSSLSSTDQQSPTRPNENEKAGVAEPPDIQQLHLQIFQYQGVIGDAKSDQKKLLSAITVYQSRIAMSPAIEEQYKMLTRDNDTALAFYKDLLAKKTAAELSANMENQQEGEQIHIVAPADMPDAPAFPDRVQCAGWGFSVGLVLGIGLALWRRWSPSPDFDEPISDGAASNVSRRSFFGSAKPV